MPISVFLDQELISYRYSYYCSSCWCNLFKEAHGSVISDRVGMKFGRIVHQVKRID